MKVIYPGSFDPITFGHIDIIKRISSSFDEVVVLVAYSLEKKGLFSPEERVEMINEGMKELKNVSVAKYNGLTVDYATQCGASAIVRGIRAVSDFENEMSMASMNKALNKDIETLTVFTNPNYSFVSSRLVKEVAHFGGSLEGMVPSVVIKNIAAKMKTKENS